MEILPKISLFKFLGLTVRHNLRLGHLLYSGVAVATLSPHSKKVLGLIAGCGRPLSVEFACSTCVCVGFPTIKNMSSSVNFQSVHMSKKG